MDAAATDSAAPGPPQYLQNVLLELLVMCGMDRQQGFRTYREPTSIRMLAQRPPLDALVQAREYLRLHNWRSGLLEIRIYLLASIVLLGVSTIALGGAHGADHLTQGVLALALAAGGYLLWAERRYWRQLRARLDHGLLYAVWLRTLAEGPAALDGLVCASPLLGRLFAMWGKPKSLRATVRYLTLSVDWSAGQPRLQFKYEWAALLFVLALSVLSLVYFWSDLRAAYSPIYMYYSVVLFSVSGWLIALVNGASRNPALLSYLVEHLAGQLQHETLPDGGAAHSTHAPLLA
jgi:hypothetical protein